MAKPDMTLGELMKVCPGDGKIKVYSEVSNPGPDDELTWRVRLPGRGEYRGRAFKRKGGLVLADEPHTFIPEN